MIEFGNVSLESGLEHVGACVRQSQMKGMDQQVVAAALMIEGLKTMFGFTPTQAHELYSHLFLLADEIGIETAAILTGRLGGDADAYRQTQYDKRANLPTSMRLPVAVASWGKTIARRMIAG